MSNETVPKTITVAALLCIVCSILVSMAAVKLKPLQEVNKELETQRNILAAAGLLGDGTNITEEFKKIDIKLVDLDKGKFVTDQESDSYNQKEAAKDPARSILISKKNDIAKIQRRAKLAQVYLVKKDDQLDTIILPIHGKGLWSTMYAFLALEADGNTVKGLSFYDHGETPGLGGEVDNPIWKSQWVGKKVFNDKAELVVDILKGKVDSTKPEAIHQADGLAGATLTAVGVENLILYWLGKNGFGPFLSSIHNQGGING